MGDGIIINMSVQRKISVGFIILLLYIMILMWFNDNRMDSVSESFDKVMYTNIENINLVNRVKTDLANGGLYLRGFIIDDNASNKKKLIDFQQELSKSIDELQKNSDSKKLKDYSSMMGDLVAKHNEIINNVIQNKEKGLDDDAVSYLTSAESANRDLMSLISSVEKYEQSELTAAQEKVDDAVRTSKLISFIIAIFGMATAVLFINRIKRIVVKPLLEVVNGAKQIAAGDLTQEDLQIKSKDEIATLAASFNEMKKNLQTIIISIGDSSRQLSASMEELAASSEEISNAADEVSNNIEITSKGANDSAEIAKDAAKATRETSKGVQLIAENSYSLFEEAKQASELAQNGGQILEVAKEQVQLISKTTGETNALIMRLKDQSSEIQNMTNAITDISEQTNLLALNAAIEAARAGEHGKGFAVVADEVRKLAEESKKSAEQIVSLISTIQNDTEIVAKSVTSNLTNVQEGVYIITNATDSFGHIYDSVDQMTIRLKDVTSTSEQLSVASDKVNTSVEEIANQVAHSAESATTISGSIEEQNATLQEMTSVVQEISKKAVELQELTQQFKV